MEQQVGDMSETGGNWGKPDTAHLRLRDPAS